MSSKLTKKAPVNFVRFTSTFNMGLHFDVLSYLFFVNSAAKINLPGYYLNTLLMRPGIS